MGSAFYRMLREFWLRDYVGDVRLLNEHLRIRGASSAGLAPVPPSVVTGDLFALTAGKCVMVLGKNPSFPGRPGDVEAARAEHANQSFDAYYERRKLFFSDTDPLSQYNWRHFSRFGNLLRAHLPAVTGCTPKEVFRSSVAVFDLLPWWSVDTRAIDPALLSAKLEPLEAWRGVLSHFTSVLRPQLIIVHGSGFRGLAGSILKTELTRFEFSSRNGYRGVAYSGQTASGIPILAHAQVTAQRGPGTSDAYRALVAAWPLRDAINGR